MIESRKGPFTVFVPIEDRPLDGWVAAVGQLVVPAEGVWTDRTPAPRMEYECAGWLVYKVCPCTGMTRLFNATTTRGAPLAVPFEKVRAAERGVNILMLIACVNAALVAEQIKTKKGACHE